MDKNYTWERRTPEWIKDNPGKGTMYKKYLEGFDPDSIEVTPEKKYVQTGFDKKAGDAPEAGIYAIVCEPEKYAYIGMSKNVPVRLRNHKMVIVGNYKTESRGYSIIKEHHAKHGMNAFTFTKIIPMPGATNKELSEKENQAMLAYATKGYSLYNGTVSLEFREACVICPKDFQPLIYKVIDLLASDTEFIDKLNDFLNPKGV